MSERRAARRLAVVTASLPVSGVPVELIVGPMTEVWSSDRRDLFEAHQAFHAARSAWLQENGYDDAERRKRWPEELRIDRGPYSLTRLREEHPGYTRDLLAQFGLPVDWEPPHTSTKRTRPRRP